MGGSRGFKTTVSNANLSAETNLFRENYLKEKLVWFDLQYGGIVTLVANQGFMGNVSAANTEILAWTRVAWVAKHFCFISKVILLGNAVHVKKKQSFNFHAQFENKLSRLHQTFTYPPSLVLPGQFLTVLSVLKGDAGFVIELN